MLVFSSYSSPAGAHRPSQRASHLALSLPCDLMKFMLLYLDRKATSWLLVLKWRQMTQVSFENIEQGCRNNIDFFSLPFNADIMAGSGVWETLFEKCLQGQERTK